METRALNVCWSGPLLEHAEDSEEDETSVRTGEIEYEQEDRLFMTRVLPEPTVEELHAASTTSQKLAEGACRSTETRREPFIPPDCVRGFESVFAKKDFDILPEHRQWDHAIELIPGLEPKSSKVYPGGTKGVGRLPGGKSAHRTNPPLEIPYGSSSVLYQEKEWLTSVGSRLSCTQFYDGQEQVPSPPHL